MNKQTGKAALVEIVEGIGIYSVLTCLAEIMKERVEADPKRAKLAKDIAVHIEQARDR